jgi:hypothetical protein
MVDYEKTFIYYYALSRWQRMPLAYRFVRPSKGLPSSASVGAATRYMRDAITQIFADFRSLEFEPIHIGDSIAAPEYEVQIMRTICARNGSRNRRPCLPASGNGEGRSTDQRASEAVQVKLERTACAIACGPNVDCGHA